MHASANKGSVFTPDNIHAETTEIKSQTDAFVLILIFSFLEKQYVWNGYPWCKNVAWNSEMEKSYWAKCIPNIPKIQ